MHPGISMAHLLTLLTNFKSNIKSLLILLFILMGRILMKRTRGVDQAVERMLCKYEAQSSNSDPTTKRTLSLNRKSDICI
jgi:hypothetical protein